LFAVQRLGGGVIISIGLSRSNNQNQNNLRTIIAFVFCGVLLFHKQRILMIHDQIPSNKLPIFNKSVTRCRHARNLKNKSQPFTNSLQIRIGRGPLPMQIRYNSVSFLKKSRKSCLMNFNSG